jgi:alkaline phosphatase
MEREAQQRPSAEGISRRNYPKRDYYKPFNDQAYSIGWCNTALAARRIIPRHWGFFSVKILPSSPTATFSGTTLKNHKNSPGLSGKDALDQLGLKDMTVKAIDILHNHSRKKGWFVMSITKPTSIDKQMHILDYDRALGGPLELDNTVKATIRKLKALGVLDERLILVTADHGHGFDATGSVDTMYINEQTTGRKKRDAAGMYLNSGLSQYTFHRPGSLHDSDGIGFSAQWDPQHTIFSGVMANPNRSENYHIHKDGPRLPTVELMKGSNNYYTNPKDAVS